MSLSLRFASRLNVCGGHLHSHVAPLVPRNVRSVVTAKLRKTALYDFHVAHQGKMVPFGGYSMPVSYGNVGQVDSHNHVRTDVGLFDVGHMVQSMIRGPSALDFLEHLTPSSLHSLAQFTSTLSVLLNEHGGIIDDLVLTKHSDHEIYIVTNAARRERDISWISENLEKWNEEREDKVELEVLEGRGLLALQGPKAAEHLQKLTPADLTPLTFGRAANIYLDGIKVHVARGGYTGEDGFEISVPPEQTLQVAESLSKPPVKLTGLGARDSLRLEAGLCLYGQDLNEDISPVEAGLTWVIAKSRRETGGFIGAEIVLKHLKDGAPRRRVGFLVEDAPAREGAKIFSETGVLIGEVTSGIPSPTLRANIAMGYVKNDWRKIGTNVSIRVRKNLCNAVVTKMPFVETHYWRG